MADEPKVTRTALDEGTSFVSVAGKSSGRQEVEQFVEGLVTELKAMTGRRCRDCGEVYVGELHHGHAVCEKCQSPFRKSYHRNCVYCAEEFMAHSSGQLACGWCSSDARVPRMDAFMEEERIEALREFRQMTEDGFKPVRVDSEDFRKWDLPETEAEWII